MIFQLIERWLSVQPLDTYKEMLISYSYLAGKHDYSLLIFISKICQDTVIKNTNWKQDQEAYCKQTSAYILLP